MSSLTPLDHYNSMDDPMIGFVLTLAIEAEYDGGIDNMVHKEDYDNDHIVLNPTYYEHGINHELSFIRCGIGDIYDSFNENVLYAMLTPLEFCVLFDGRRNDNGFSVSFSWY